jgi:hypothetical protein
MAPTEPEKLIQEWIEYRNNLQNEGIRSQKIIEVLKEAIPGISIGSPPAIDFDSLIENRAAKSASNGSKREVNFNKFKWYDKFTEIMENEDPLGPLYSHRRMTKVISKRWPEIADDSENRNRISTALAQFFAQGKCGRVEFAGPRYEYGHLRYFSDPTTLKAKYAHMGENSEPQEDTHTHFSSLPDLFAPKPEPIGRTLTSKELKDWHWAREIKKFLDEYDPSQNGLPTAFQVATKLGELNKPLKINGAALSSVNSTLGLLWKKGEIGRMQADGRKAYVYGPLKYFADKSKLKDEFEYLRLNTEEETSN